MKTSLLLLVLLLACSGCHHFSEGVVGSGKRLVQKREVPAFNAISTDGAFDIEVVCQQQQSLELEGDDNILELVSTEVSGQVLHVKSDRGYSTSNNIVLRITVPDLASFTANGAGTLEVKGMKNERFEVDVNGAPTIRLQGETGLLTIDTNGAGKIDARKLRAAKAEVDSNGVSKVEVNARENLKVTVSGPSQVFYEGDPTVDKTVNGPGSVEKRQSEPT